MNKLTIIKDESAVGLGSTVLRVLHHLYYLKPKELAYYEMHNRLYTNSGNTWNKFFIQPFEKHKEQIKADFNTGNYTITSDWGNGNKFFLSYGKDQRRDQFTNKELVEPVRDVFKKFIHIKPAILDEAEAYIKTHISNRNILSVHVRGTDMFNSHAANQLHLMEYEKFIKPAVQDKLSQQKFDTIFLATDNSDTVDNFRKDYGNILLKRDTELTTNNNPYGIHYSNVHSTDEKKYKLGVDMLVDAVIMSVCNYSLCVRSNVSILNILMRDNYNYKFIDDHIDYGRAG